ncbi:spore ii aa: anti-sigma f factor antagonist [Lucifera butyrica]|uniref:Anti-sigma F factor antagonist n=1 Tax=Lucifera butyrica TaxID=1351585 RepID=A0A498RA08_9FIRM|nr:anti-sigma F factor antagonist [Lucifera butyrica]VBB07989.1 spore ii aa: anti-sigma f factor antagonist [Lucifera butyrica]
MQITTAVRRGVLIVNIAGELDMHVADEFRKVVDDALEKTGVTNMLLNLEGVSFIDSSGLGVILGRYKKLNLLGGKMGAVQLQPQVERIFELSGLLKIMKLYATESDALERV